MTFLPKNYVIKKFYEYGYGVERAGSNYCCSCPICLEGKSFGKKKRCWYIPDKDLIYCHNCGWSSRPLKWIMEAGQLSYNDVMEEVKEGEYTIINLDRPSEINFNNILSSSSDEALPLDSIDLSNDLQMSFYKSSPTVAKALEYIKNRKLDVAINKPNTFFISLTDPVHKNRLIIPFYDINDKIVWYQTRAIGANIDGDKENVRYLSKKKSPRTIFNINKIDENIKEIFIFEGPIDACFVKNGIAIAGINTSSNSNFSEVQEQQIEPFLYNHDFIWCLDSQWLDDAAYEKTKILLKENKAVFLWPESIGKKYKDFNEICKHNNLNGVAREFIIQNTIYGESGLLEYMLKMANR